jgi:hypothetical protein
MMLCHAAWEYGKSMKQELEHHSRFDKRQSLCVILPVQTTPRASTVEYFPKATTIYILTEGGVKIENIIRNPNVSIAIHAPFDGWQTVRGIQITGLAEIGRRGSGIYEEGLDVFNKCRGQIGTVPDIMSVIKVKPSKIEYIDTALGNKGFKVRHTLVC